MLMKNKNTAYYLLLNIGKFQVSGFRFKNFATEASGSQLCLKFNVNLYALAVKSIFVF